MLRRRILLPVIQVLIAVALTTANRLRPDPPGNPAWIQPDKTICDALNAPAALLRLWLRMLWSHFFSHEYQSVEVLIDTVIFFGLVALLWYGVALEVEGGGRSVILPANWMRIPADIAAVVLAPAVIVVLSRIGPHIDSRPLTIIVTGIYFGWVIVIGVFYGRDLYLYLRDARRDDEGRGSRGLRPTV